MKAIELEVGKYYRNGNNFYKILAKKMDEITNLVHFYVSRFYVSAEGDMPETMEWVQRFCDLGDYVEIQPALYDTLKDKIYNFHKECNNLLELYFLYFYFNEHD